MVSPPVHTRLRNWVCAVTVVLLLLLLIVLVRQIAWDLLLVRTCPLLLGPICAPLLRAADSINSSTATSQPSTDVSIRQSSFGYACDRVPPSLLRESREFRRCDIVDEHGYHIASWNKPVHLTLLYGSLDPASLEHIIEHLYPAYESLGRYLHVELVPSGYAHVSKDGRIVCHRGNKGRVINRFQSCAIKYLRNHVQYVHCLSKALREEKDFVASAVDCFEEQWVPRSVRNRIRECYISSEGWALQTVATQRTANVSPDSITQFPWMLFNNVSLSNQQYRLANLSSAVCDFYVGDDFPSSCGPH